MSDRGYRPFNLLRIYCQGIAISALVLGCLILFGWAFRVEVPLIVLLGLAKMKPNAAMGLAFSGIALGLLLPGESRVKKDRVARLLALFVVLIGAATLIEYVFHLNSGIDQLLFRDIKPSIEPAPPGRMAPIAAIVFSLLGLALMLLDWQPRRGRRPAQALSLSAGLIAMMGISGYIYHATASSSLLLHTHIPAGTAITLFLLSAAVFFARPRAGIAGDLTSERSGSAMAQRFLPAIFLAPVALGWICLEGQAAGIFGTDLTLALYATANVIVFAVLVWLSAGKMNQEHVRRSKAEAELRQLNAELEGRVAERTKALEEQAAVLAEHAALLDLAQDAIIVRDMLGQIVFWNRGAETLFGWSSKEALGRNTYELLKTECSVPQEIIETELMHQGRWHGDVIHHKRDGQPLILASRWALQRNADGMPARILTINNDITERKRAENALLASEEQLAHLAKHDFLTDLPNRRLLNDQLRQTIAMAQRHRKNLALLFLDLDGFKYINDSLGHPTGDKLLQSVAKRLVDCVRNSDTVSRSGGDEFVVLLSEVEHPEDAAVAASRILQAVAEPHLIDGHDLQLTASIGVSVYPDDGIDAETLTKNADAAMYQAKENGPGRFRFFKPAMYVRAAERQSIEQSLRGALQRQEFVLYYQPKIDLRTLKIIGAEALIRWAHPVRGLLPPAKFIPIAEDCGLILPIGKWVLREACRQARVWADARLPMGTMAVNISAMEFRDDNFQEDVFATLEETELNPRSLELELTESVLMKRADFAECALKTLRARGVRLAIDDFGTGYSSFSYLKRFAIDVLKIDQSFVREITSAPAETTIVTTIISMSRSLNLRVVAEGVETKEELTFLQAHLCDEAQGNYFSPPVTPQQFTKLLEMQSPRLVGSVPSLAGLAPR